MNKKILGLVAFAIIVVTLGSVILVGLWLGTPQLQQELDFTVTGTNECLRFLTRTVQTAYVPFRTGANEQWLLTVECVDSADNAWTEVYVYEGYWDDGAENKCMSEDLYPIIDEIESMDFEIRTNNTFTRVFGESILRSCTLFFIFPAGGSSTYHIKLNQTS